MQTKNITALTPDQEALFPVFVKKWTDIGLCIDPADRPRAERAVRMMYENAGLKHPRIIWCGSPLGNAVAKILWEKIQDVSENSVLASVEASLWDSVRDSVWDSVSDSVWGSIYSQHEAHWLAFYDFFREIGLVEETQALEGLWELAQSACWILPYESVCFISDRPEIVSLENNRIHSETGPAIRFRDGFEIYGWKGIRIPKEWITDKSFLTPTKIDAIENVELRRCATEIFGEKRYIEEGGAEKIHEDAFGILYRKEIPGDEPIVMVQVENGTVENGVRRKFFLQVHPELRPLLREGKLGDPQEMTALNAVASTYGMRGEEYRHIRRRT